MKTKGKGRKERPRKLICIPCSASHLHTIQAAAYLFCWRQPNLTWPNLRLVSQLFRFPRRSRWFGCWLLFVLFCFALTIFHRKRSMHLAFPSLSYERGRRPTTAETNTFISVVFFHFPSTELADPLFHPPQQQNSVTDKTKLGNQNRSPVTSDTRKLTHTTRKNTIETQFTQLPYSWKQGKTR